MKPNKNILEHEGCAPDSSADKRLLFCSPQILRWWVSSEPPEVRLKFTKQVAQCCQGLVSLFFYVYLGIIHHLLHVPLCGLCVNKWFRATLIQMISEEAFLKIRSVSYMNSVKPPYSRHPL